MSVDLERKLQNKVLHWLVDSEQDGGLGYTYLGNLLIYYMPPITWSTILIFSQPSI